MRWWRRNRAALAALVVIVPLALLASSYRYLTLYPQFVLPVKSTTDTTIRVDQPITIGKKPPVASTFVMNLDHLGQGAMPGYTPVPGATLWRADLSFEADPSMPVLCTRPTLRDASGREFAPFVNMTTDGLLPYASCVPSDTPGPTLDVDGTLVPAEAVRPRTWTITWLFAVPDGVTPTALRMEISGVYEAEFSVG